MELWLRSYRQLKEYGVDRPTHVFVQAGVGSLAGAVQGYVASIYDECPITVVVEADEADCYYKSAKLEMENQDLLEEICQL
ncbi:diaminopropionate ammonia-lyase domain protein [Clostridioides difficile CD201]|uniref:diaminopropionate ammonia-lyase domain protein n=1 Tax=Clostridioides difficile TaxID=1496 RepID=UPI00038D7949|nr:diaminopropionate ammonia-lyase domain protein [Clostridioides difficile]EQF66791.1 diaminopropionate ammonia-lyase domain protein [Clostridioides difficile CD201]EQF68702.1 diaminopropionate ammonia-lyase domain protein [Clostridioides difficile CD201]